MVANAGDTAGGQILVAAAATCGIHHELDPNP
jgi:hypothetical protein